MQYENNLRKKMVLQRKKNKTRFGFKKVHLEKGGRLIIRVVLYSGQYGSSLGAG